MSQEIKVNKTELRQGFRATPPGSKSLTNRALIAAALCSETVELLNPLESEDTEVAMEAIERLGVHTEKLDRSLKVSGTSLNSFAEQNPVLYLGNAGTAVRFLSAVLCAKGVVCRIDGSDRMRERPIEILLKGLTELGGEIHSIENNGCPPLQIGDHPLQGGETTLSGQVSSQYFSGLMMACPLAKKESIIRVSDDWLSLPYIEMTQKMLRAFQIRCDIKGKEIVIPGHQKYVSPGRFQIEPDATAATYPLTLAALHRIPVKIDHLGCDSLQGDVQYAEVLKLMGAQVIMHKDYIEADFPEPLKAIEYNAESIPDAAMSLVVLLAVTPGKSRLTGLRNLKFKECDRLTALETELGRIGAKVHAFEDGFEIEGVLTHDLQPAKIKTYKDHRMAMCLSLLGTCFEGMVIDDPACVEKTYPDYWNDLKMWVDSAQ